VLHQTILLLDQAPSSRPPSLGRGPQRSGTGWNRGVQEATTTGRANRSRPTRPTTSLQLTASRSPVAKGCALPPLCGPAHHSAERKRRTKALLRRVVHDVNEVALVDLIPYGMHPVGLTPGSEATSVSAGQAPVSWAWLDLNQRPHPQVKIPGRGGKLPGTYQGRRGPRPLRGAVNGPGPCRAAHLHPSGVAAGHEPLISNRGLTAVQPCVFAGGARP
jgi:hypothetical protein